MPNFEDRDRDIRREDPRDRKPGTTEPSEERERDKYGREGQAPGSREPGSGRGTGMPSGREESGQNEPSRGSGPSGSREAE
ncbi:MAG: hypothetical protein ACM3SU_02355 [Acidobacteriota bacterium]